MRLAMTPPSPTGPEVMQTQAGFNMTSATLGSHGNTPSLPVSVAGGIENPAFMADLDPVVPLQIPPWLAEAELDSGGVAPSQRAQTRPPLTAGDLRRLAPLRISTQSTDSFMMADIPDAEQRRDSFDLPPPPPPPPKDGYHQ